MVAHLNYTDTLFSNANYFQMHNSVELNFNDKTCDPIRPGLWLWWRCRRSSPAGLTLTLTLNLTLTLTNPNPN